jgi:DNA replication protein DnaC
VPCPCSAEGLVRSRLLIADVPERFWDAEAKMLAGSAYIHGATGVGKTTRACGALKAWTIANGEGARFMSVRAFQDAIGRAIHDGAADPLERYERAPFLVIDDLGKERVTPETWKKLDSLMDTRYGWPSRVTVITSEFALTDLAARIDALAPDKPGAAFARRISALVADRIYRR